MVEYSVRPASVDDLDELLKFEQEIIKAERPFDPTIREGQISYYDIRELIESNNAEVVVVEVAGEVVASGYAKIREARHYLDHDLYSYLGFMYTVPQHRGRGLNAKIIAALKEWSLKKGLTEIRLTVYQENVGAIKAYEKAGFGKHICEMRLRVDEAAEE